MEGPFLSPKKIEGVPEADAKLMPPSVEKLNEFIDAAEGHMKMMGVGIEQPGAYDVIRRLRECGIVASVAHTKNRLRRL